MFVMTYRCVLSHSVSIDTDFNTDTFVSKFVTKQLNNVAKSWNIMEMQEFLTKQKFKNAKQTLYNHFVGVVLAQDVIFRT